MVVTGEYYFITSNKPLWAKGCLMSLNKFLNNLKKTNPEKVNNRPFKIFDMEIKQAIKKFAHDVASVQMIMNCRTKCDTDSYFGGIQCAELMRKIINSCEKYAKESDLCIIEINDEKVNIFQKLKEKAKKDIQTAGEFEKRTKEIYLATGIDHTTDIFVSAGYEPAESFKDIFLYLTGV